MPVEVKEITEVEIPVIRVDRDYAIPKASLWEWVTKSELTAQWIGPWEKTGEQEIQLTMVREEGSPEEPVRILELNEGDGYTVQLNGLQPAWVILVSLSEVRENQSHLTLIQPLEGEEYRSDIQAGWEYYADCLAAAITGTEAPDFSVYLDSSSGPDPICN